MPHLGKKEMKLYVNKKCITYLNFFGKGPREFNMGKNCMNFGLSQKSKTCQ